MVYLELDISVLKKLTILLFIFCNSLGYTQTSSSKRLFKAFDSLKYNDFEHAKKIALLTLKTLDTSNKDYNYFKAYLNLSEIYIFKANYKTSNYYLETITRLFSDSLVSNNVDTNLRIKYYNTKSVLEKIKNNFNKALYFSERAIALSKQNEDSRLLIKSYLVRAALLSKQQQFENAAYYLKMAESLSKKNTTFKYLSDIYFINGNNIYTKKKDTSLYFFKESLKYSDSTNNPFMLGKIYSNLSQLYVYHDDLEKVLEPAYKAKALAEKVGDSTTLQEVYFTLGVYYESKENYPKAIDYYRTAVDTYRKYVSPMQLANTYWMFSGALWHNKDFEEAYDIQEKYIYLKDSVYSLEKTRQFEALRTQYEVEKKDNQITLLEQENQLAATRRKWIIATGILIFIALIGLFLYYRQRAKTQQKIRAQEKALHEKETERLQKEQELVAIKSQIEGQDKERHRIAKELHDGVGGQLASVTMALSHLNTDLKSNKITTIHNHLKTTFSEIRSLSHSLSENYHKEKSLQTLIAQLKQSYENINAFNIEISIYPENGLDCLSESIKHNTYRVLQELFNNTHKHAQATLVQLSINGFKDHLVILYEDNGVGFDLKTNANGIGVKNIEERIITLNGKIDIDAVPNRGTHFSIEIPLNNTL